MRKLATAAMAFSAAVFLAYYLIPPELYLPCTGVSLLLTLGAVPLRGDVRLRLLLVCLAVAVGFAASYVSLQQKTLPAREISGEKLSIEARVTDYPKLYENFATVRVRLTGENTPRLYAELYSFGNELDALSPGDLISAPVTLKAADERYGLDFGADNAENVYLLCYLDDELTRLGKSPNAFLYFPKTLAQAVKSSAQRVFPADTVPLMTALLTGDTVLLYQDTKLYAAMSEAGILHVVAISGMNVAFLVGFISLLVRRKRTAALVSIPVIWLFVSFAGGAPSVLRSAFMATTVLLAPLLRRENDVVTALTAILALILLVNPAACASINLQLSFLAMLGMLFVTPRIYETMRGKTQRKKRSGEGLEKALARLRDGVLATFAATVGAMVFTVPVTALYFGYVSLIGILVNVLVFWTVPVCFIGGYIACSLVLIWLPLGTLFGAVTSLFAYFIIGAVRIAAEVPYAAVYTQGKLFAYWLILVYAVFLLGFIFRRKSGFWPAIPVCLSVLTLCSVILASEIRAGQKLASVTALDVGQGQSLVFTAERVTALIDCGGKGKLQNAGDTAASFLLGQGRRSVDLLMLTHFDADHVNGVKRLMSRVAVKRLILPGGPEEKEGLETLLALAEEQDTQVYIINQDTEIDAEGLSVAIYRGFDLGAPSLIYIVRIGGFETLVTGDAELSEEAEFLAAHALPDAELYVAGHHGSKNASSAELLSVLKAEYAFVSCGYNTYGHPTEEALTRFEVEGMTVYRTDISGNVSLRIPTEGG